ncbi:MAG: GntR family transcriptional regulator [Pseudonocardia sediminis]
MPGTGEPLDRDDPRPLYAQLRDVVAGQIAGHTLLPGDALPTEQELQDRYGVARSVVRQALDELAGSGLIHRRRGRGSVVAPSGDYRREVARAGGLGEQMAEAGRTLRTRIEDVRRARPPGAARTALGTADTFRIDRLRLVGDEPVVFVRTWVPVDVLPADPSATRERLGTTSLHDLLREYGHTPSGGRRHVQAVPADEHVGSRLAVAVGEPLLLLEGVTRDADGRGLEWSSTWHRPNTVFDIDARVEPDDPGPGPGHDDGAADGAVDRVRDLVDRLSAAVADLERG